MAIRCDGGICGHNGCIVTPVGSVIIHRVNLLLQQTERHGETVNGGGRCWRAAGDPNINGDNGVAAAPDAVEIVEKSAAAPHAP